MAGKAESKTSTAPALGSVITVHTKSPANFIALVEPEIVTMEGVKFIQGKQITGKLGHQMEGKRTLIPCDNVACVTEFETEEDVWSGPQPRFIQPPIDDSPPSAVLTSHEPQRGQGQGHRGHHGNQGNQGNQGPNNRNRHRGGGGGGSRHGGKR